MYEMHVEYIHIPFVLREKDVPPLFDVIEKDEYRHHAVDCPCSCVVTHVYIYI